MYATFEFQWSFFDIKPAWLLYHLQQKARDNRAALRINKVQMSNETIKRQPTQPQQPLEVFDPAIPPLDPELLFKDPLKHKESEHEQEWKFRQVSLI